MSPIEPILSPSRSMRLRPFQAFMSSMVGMRMPPPVKGYETRRIETAVPFSAPSVRSNRHTPAASAHAEHFVSVFLRHAVAVAQQKESRRQRSDAAENRGHIVRVAGHLLRKRPRATMTEVAAAAHVSRGTLYRHFPTRADLLASVNEQARDAAVTTSEDRLRPAGELARATPTPMSVADVLNQVPPHLLGEQIVAEAMRIGGVTSAAVYLVDLE